MVNEKLVSKYKKALNAVQNCIKYYDATIVKQVGTFDYEMAVTSSIKTFELAYETFWKYLKFYIENQGIQDVPGNPRGLFDLALKLKIITLEQTNTLYDAGKDRNEAVHIYQQATADNIFKDIPEYTKLFVKLLKTLTLDS